MQRGGKGLVELLPGRWRSGRPHVGRGQSAHIHHHTRTGTTPSALSSLLMSQLISIELTVQQSSKWSGACSAGLREQVSGWDAKEVDR
jgi:hypothetical protein